MIHNILEYVGAILAKVSVLKRKNLNEELGSYKTFRNISNSRELRKNK